jgi:hypothetical protein
MAAALGVDCSCFQENQGMQATVRSVGLAARSARGTVRESMPDPMRRPPGNPPREPIVIRIPLRVPEVPEIDGSYEEEDEAEIRRSPGIIPEMPPPPRPEERARRL